jgi:hypothetical protein
MTFSHKLPPDLEALIADIPEGSVGNRSAKSRSRDKEEPPTPPEIRLKLFRDIIKPVPKNWLIKNVIALGNTSSWIAPPGRGKSGLLTDIAVHLAAGLDWRGYRTKGRHGVVYFALERADLVERRLAAYRLRDGLDDSLPIAVCGQIIDLMDKGCVNAVVNAIKKAEDAFQRKVGLAIVDTYAKGIAAGGGDENVARDQNMALANLRRVIDETGIHFATIGHTGKDVSKGERGSNAKLGDVDLEVQIKGDNVKEATVTKANDQPEGPLTSFRLEPFDFEPDEDGDPFQTYILSTDAPAAETATEKRMSPQQILAMDALVEVLLANGRPAPADEGFPRGIRVVEAEHWHSEMCRNGAIDRDKAGHRARYYDLRKTLKVRRLIGLRDEYVWDARRVSTDVRV